MLGVGFHVGGFILFLLSFYVQFLLLVSPVLFLAGFVVFSVQGQAAPGKEVNAPGKEVNAGWGCGWLEARLSSQEKKNCVLSSV